MPLAQSRLRRYRTPALVLAIVLLVGVGVATIRGIREFSRSTEWVGHSYQVIAAIDATEAAVRTVESNARAYRLTSKPEHLAEYLSTLPRTSQLARTLATLTTDNAGQRTLAAELQRRVQARLEEIARLNELQVRAGAETARQASIAGTGVQLMGRLSATAEEMRMAEQQLLVRRLAATEQRAQLLMGFVILGILLPLALLGALMASLTKENRRSRALEREARQAVRDLEDSLVQRDRLSEQRRTLGDYAGMLQSCQSIDEAMGLTANVVTELLPAAGGRCYAMRASQNLAETTARFGVEVVPTSDLLQPEQCWALRRGQPHQTDDTHGHVRCSHLDATKAIAGTWTFCVPLIAQGTSLGLLHVSALARDVDGDSDAVVLEAIAEQLSLAMVNLQLRETLRVQSIRDPLTSLFNRRYLEENLQRELQRCERRQLPLSVLMIDVDHFKRFNDEHGHGAGDALLARIGLTLAALTRNEDIACRYGGEEFTVVLPEATAADAQRRAEEIRAAIATTTILHLRQSLGPATASIGIATFPADGDHPERLLAVADAALYRAKAAGRNRVAAQIEPLATAHSPA